MRRSSIKKIWPDGVELSYIALIVCIVLILGNGKMILEKIGLISSADVIGQQVSTKVNSGIIAVDSFHFTANAVNLIVWGCTGLIIYSALQSLVGTLRQVAYERDFDSNRYVHPQSFTHKAYWRQIVADTILGFTLLVTLVICAILYVVVALPASFAYTQRFILHPAVSTSYGPIIGLLVAFISTVVIYYILKLVIHHHRLAVAEA